MPGVMSMKTGEAARPLMTIASIPADLKAAPQVPPEFEVPMTPGQRRLEDHVAAAGRRRVRPDEGRRGDDDDVVRAERIALRIDGVIEEARGQAAAAEVIGDEARRSSGRTRTSPAAEVDLGIFSVESVW